MTACSYAAYVYVFYYIIILLLILIYKYKTNIDFAYVKWKETVNNLHTLVTELTYLLSRRLG